MRKEEFLSIAEGYYAEFESLEESSTSSNNQPPMIPVIAGWDSKCTTF